MIPAMVLGKFIIRFCVNYEYQTEEHIGKLEIYIYYDSKHII